MILYKKFLLIYCLTAFSGSLPFFSDETFLEFQKEINKINIAGETRKAKAYINTADNFNFKLLRFICEEQAIGASEDREALIKLILRRSSSFLTDSLELVEPVRIYLNKAKEWQTLNEAPEKLIASFRGKKISSEEYKGLLLSLAEAFKSIDLKINDYIQAQEAVNQYLGFNWSGFRMVDEALRELNELFV